MSGTYLVRGARQLLTLQGSAEPRRGAALQDLKIIREGSLLIRDGRILEVGLTRRIENLAQARGSQEIDATGRVVMPGFVDCHAHLVWPAPSLGDIKIGACRTAQPSAANTLRSASAKRLAFRARPFLNGMAQHGTTTVGAVSGHGLDPRDELKILRVHAKLDRSPLDIVSTFMAPPGVPDAYAADPAGYLAGLSAGLLPTIHQRARVRFAGLDCGGAIFTVEQIRRYLETIRALGFQLKIQAGESPLEGSLRLAVEMGAVSVEHLCGVSAEETQMLAASNTMAVLLPAGRRCASARPLIEAGAAVALGSGFHPGFSSTYSMPSIIALACANLCMTPAEAICAATFNAACAIGFARVAGSFEVGKAADVIVWNASDYREIPYYLGVNRVHRILKDGVTIYDEGQGAHYRI